MYKSSIGDTDVTHIPGNGVFEEIPALLHLYWDGSKMSFIQLLTIISFNHHNPGWKIYLWMPIKKTEIKTWSGFENKVKYENKDYFGEIQNIPNVVIKILDFDEIGFHNNVSEVFKSDYLRYWALYNYGGGYSDFFIIFLKTLIESG